MKGPSLPEVATAKLREAQRLVRLQRSYDAECVASDAKALFERLEDQSGVLDANYFLLQAALIEERINDAAKIAEDGLESARKAGNGMDEVKMLRASLLIKLAEGKPLDALEIAAKAEGVLMKLEKNHQEAGELLLLVAQAHMLQGTTLGQQAALNAALQAVDHFAKAEDGRGEANSWRVVFDARVALGRFEDGLRAAEAAMVICADCGDEVGQALCLLSLSKAHLLRGSPVKAKKASEKALNLFHEQNSDLMAAAALEILVQALIKQEQRKEALQRAKQELLSFMGSGDKWAVPRMRGCLVMALRSMDRKKEALSEAEKALEAAEELTKGHAAGSPVPSMMVVEAMKQVAILNMLTGKVDKAKELADKLLPMCRQLGDLEGEALMNDLIGKAVQERGVFEEKAAKEMEAEELIFQLKEAMMARDAESFKSVLGKCYENENVFTEAVEEIITPVIETDPEGLYEFFLKNQPDNWQVNPDEDRKFDSGTHFDRRLLYYAFRMGAMGYGPGFRLIKSAYRMGSDEDLPRTQAFGSLDLMDTAPDWEERVFWHAGMLDCVLQVGAARGVKNSFKEPSEIKVPETEPELA